MEHRTHGFTTPELARHVGISAEGLRVHLCKRGSYFGLKPERLPNGRLLWPADSLEKLRQRAKDMPPRPVPHRKTGGE
jgi:hypothetical protein